jgi:internalin A
MTTNRLAMLRLACIAMGVGVFVMVESQGAASDEENVIKALEALGGKVERDEAAPGKPAIGVDLSGTKAGDDDLKDIAALVELRRLDLTDTKITDLAISHILKLGSLSTLSLTNTAVGNQGLLYINNMTSLRVLLLGGTKVTDQGLERLHYMNLESLHLSSNRNITDAGLVSVGRLPRLETLRISNTQVRRDFGHLAWPMKLLVLDLGDTSVDDTGLQQLEGCTRLSTLNLSGTNVTDSGMDDLRRIAALEILYLRGLPVSDAGLMKLGNLCKLKRIYIKGTNVTPIGVAAFKKAHPTIELFETE